MPKLNTKNLLILLTILFAVIVSVLYQHQKQSSILEAEKRIEIFMKKWLALFHYIEVEQKEVLYNLEETGLLLKKGYFEPKLLSFTYIARQIQHKYEENEIANGKIPYGYRLAATTPRNAINKATKHEEEILKKFRNNETTKYTEFLYKNGEKFYTSYTPIEKTTETCMRCHSTPDKAPQGLVERYGKQVGFGESIGEIRGMVIMEIPFTEIEKETLNIFIFTLFTVLFIFIVFFSVLNIIIRKDEKLSKANTQLELLSNTDKITNIANRRSFDLSLTQQWKLMQRAKTPISLILCDIDYFKLYNDTYGHQAGDNCLALVAQAIADSTKRPSDLVARYGGEEFAVILPDTDNEGAVKIAKQIQANIYNLNIEHSASTILSVVTISMGITTHIVKDGDSTDLFIERADKLLYKAKSEGRNCYVAS